MGEKGKHWVKREGEDIRERPSVKIIRIWEKTERLKGKGPGEGGTGSGRSKRGKAKCGKDSVGARD